MKDQLILVRHILGAIDRVEQYTLGMSKEEFLSNFLVQDGVLRNSEIIGEACKNINSEMKEQYSQIPWRDITAMRNKLIHEYFGVDIETLWNVIQFNLAELKKHVLTIINSEEA